MLTKFDNRYPETCDIDLDDIEQKMLDMPQADCGVKHHFGPGIYIREVVLPPFIVAVGHYHKTEHLCTMVKGSMMILQEDGSTKKLCAPCTFVAKPGRKMVYTLEEVVFQNIFATDETDIEKLEDTYLTKSKAFVEDEKNRMTDNYIECQAHRDDYLATIKELGMSHEQALEIAENEEDQIEMPGPVHPYIISNSPIQGKGYFLTMPASAGAILAPANIAGKRTPAGRYVNHSANPNAKMQLSESGDIYLVAIRDICGCIGGRPGDEVTINYAQAVQMVQISEHKRGERLCHQ